MRQFYNPALSQAEIDDLDWANWIMLMTVQALFGAVGDNTVAVAVDVESRAGVRLHWWLSIDDEDDRAEAHDAADEPDVFGEGRFGVEVEIHVGERPQLAE